MSVIIDLLLASVLDAVPQKLPRPIPRALGHRILKPAPQLAKGCRPSHLVLLQVAPDRVDLRQRRAVLRSRELFQQELVLESHPDRFTALQ
jgi:hypothetical protein